MRDWIIVGPDGQNYTVNHDDFTIAAKQVLADWKKLDENRVVGKYIGKDEEGNDKLELSKEFMDDIWMILFSK